MSRLRFRKSFLKPTSIKTLYRSTSLDALLRVRRRISMRLALRFPSCKEQRSYNLRRTTWRAPLWLQVGLQMFMINPNMDMSTIYIILYIYVYVHNISTNRIFTQTTCRALSCSWGCRHRHSKHSVSRLLQQKAAVLLIGQVSRVAWGYVGM